MDFEHGQTSVNIHPKFWVSNIENASYMPNSIFSVSPKYVVGLILTTGWYIEFEYIFACQACLSAE